MSDRRDDELGAALRGLDVPEHGPDFFPTLMTRLEAEAARRPARRAGIRWSRPLMLTAAAASIAVIVFSVSALLPGGDSSVVGPRIATAAEVRTRVARALATVRSLQGELSFECAVPYADCYPPETGGTTIQRWSLSADAAGRERITALDGTSDSAYDPAAGAARELATRDGRREAAEYVNLPAGPPDYTPRSPMGREYASLVRAFLASTGDAPVTTATIDTRQVWRLDVAVQPNKLAGPDNSGDRISIVVDQQTGFPVQITESLGTRRLLETRLTKLVVNPAIPDATFALAFPPGARPFRQDYGFQRTTVEAAAAAAGYRPILPTFLPQGFTRAEITVARESMPTGAEGMNPEGRSVVSVAYRRGFDRIVVTTRLTGADRSLWADPVATGEGFPDVKRPVAVTEGALAGAAAELVVTPRGIPHVWAVNGRFVTTIAGDATGAELTRMLGSMG